jgi:hypothetical protein
MKGVLIASLSLTVLLTAGCADPETKCRQSVEKMKADLVGVVGSGDHKTADSPYVQAHTQLDIAQAQLATGNYAGCLDSIDAAKARLAEAKNR